MRNIERHIRRKFHVHNVDTPPYTGWVGSTRSDLYDLFAELGYKVGAEIGVNRAANAVDMFNRIPDLKLFCVDPWDGFRRNSAAHMERQYQRALRNLDGRNAVIMRKKSIDAVGDFEDRSLDFVYIDGMHDFDNVMLDIIFWSKKVRRGGIVSGHDYFYGADCKVPRAVDAYCLAHGIRDVFLTREMRKPQSWYWVNK